MLILIESQVKEMSVTQFSPTHIDNWKLFKRMGLKQTGTRYRFDAAWPAIWRESISVYVCALTEP